MKKHEVLLDALKQSSANPSSLEEEQVVMKIKAQVQKCGEDYYGKNSRAYQDFDTTLRNIESPESRPRLQHSFELIKPEQNPIIQDLLVKLQALRPSKSSDNGQNSIYNQNGNISINNISIGGDGALFGSTINKRG